MKISKRFASLALSAVVVLGASAGAWVAGTTADATTNPAASAVPSQVQDNAKTAAIQNIQETQAVVVAQAEAKAAAEAAQAQAQADAAAAAQAAAEAQKSAAVKKTTEPIPNGLPKGSRVPRAPALPGDTSGPNGTPLGQPLVGECASNSASTGVDGESYCD